MHAMYVYIAQWTELHEEIRKSQQPIDLKHTDAESQKWSEKNPLQKYMKNVASNYYMMKKYIKNQVYTNWLRTKCDLVMCPAH